MATTLLKALSGSWFVENLDAAVEAGLAHLAQRLVGDRSQETPRFVVSSSAPQPERWPVEPYCAVTGLGGARLIVFREYFRKGPDLTGATPFRYVVVTRTAEGVNRPAGFFTSPNEARDSVAVIAAVLGVSPTETPD